MNGIKDWIFPQFMPIILPADEFGPIRQMLMELPEASPERGKNK